MMVTTPSGEHSQEEERKYPNMCSHSFTSPGVFVPCSLPPQMYGGPIFKKNNTLGKRVCTARNLCQSGDFAWQLALVNSLHRVEYLHQRLGKVLKVWNGQMLVDGPLDDVAGAQHHLHEILKNNHAIAGNIHSLETSYNVLSTWIQPQLSPRTTDTPHTIL